MCFQCLQVLRIHFQIIRIFLHHTTSFPGLPLSPNLLLSTHNPALSIHKPRSPSSKHEAPHSIHSNSSNSSNSLNSLNSSNSSNSLNSLKSLKSLKSSGASRIAREARSSRSLPTKECCNQANSNPLRTRIHVQIVIEAAQRLGHNQFYAFQQNRTPTR